MKILFLSQRFLLPMDTGGKIRTGTLLEKLSEHHHITLVSNIESPKDDKWLDDIPKLCSRFIPVRWKEIQKYSLFFFFRLFIQMFSIYPVNVLNDYSNKLRRALEKELSQEKYDIAICDFVQSALLFKHITNIPTLLFQHNVESVISKRHIKQNTNPSLKLFWWLQFKKMYYYEKSCCKNFDSIIAVSENDRDTFKQIYNAKNVHAIPTGVDIEYFKPSKDISVVKNSLVFCGSMDWLPNEDAILFFIQEILPELEKDIKDINFTVVGRRPSNHLKQAVKKNPNVTLTGWVDDIRHYLAKSALVIVPIRVGGGTRMKIYEAMSMGKTVVTTSIGAEGLPVRHNEHLMIEDNPVKFAKTITDLLFDQKKCEGIGMNARQYVEQNASWKIVSNIFSGICRNTANMVI